MDADVGSDVQPDADKREAFSRSLGASIRDASMVELLLTKYRGDEDLKRVLIRTILLRGEPHLSFVYRYETQDITKNYPIVEGLESIPDLLGSDFRAGHLFTTTQDLQIEFTKEGQAETWRVEAVA